MTAEPPPTVLVVEDDVMVREVIRLYLSMDGYHVLEAADGVGAVAASRRHPGPIHLLVADVGLGRDRGPEVWRRLAADRPGLPAVFISGAASALSGPGDPPADGENFLRKPFTGASLLAKVGDVLARDGAVVLA